MKNLKLMSVFAAALWLGACSSDSGTTEPAGGTGGQAQGGSSGSGGAGTSSGSGGSASGSGGSSGQAGAGKSGGAGGMGGSSGSSSGSGGGGLAGQSGTGGRVGSGGGTTDGGVGSGGTSGSGGSGSDGGSGTQHWVGTWTASPYQDTNTSNAPPISLSNSVVRQVTHVSLGGSQIRVQFSNLVGNGPVTISGAHIALCKANPVDSTIDATTDAALAFSGSASVTVALGKEVWSDPIDFAVPNQGNITITTAFGSVPSTLTQHSGARTTSYFQSGSGSLNAATMASAQAKDLWFYISGIDVMADQSAKGVVAIGDSITDGRGTTTNANNRWTDVLAARLQGNAATANVSTMNQGIGATSLVGTSGTAAQARFARDVLGQSGVKYVIVLDGVNDIGGGSSFATMKPAYDDLIKRAHDKGLLIYGATILPFGGNTGTNGYYSAAHESVRQEVNTYIKSGVFDGVIDFDAALTDGGSPPKLQAAYSTWAQADGLHPGPAGYQKMGETPDLTLFTK